MSEVTVELKNGHLGLGVFFWLR